MGKPESLKLITQDIFLLPYLAVWQIVNEERIQMFALSFFHIEDFFLPVKVKLILLFPWGL